MEGRSTVGHITDMDTVLQKRLNLPKFLPKGMNYEGFYACSIHGCVDSQFMADTTKCRESHFETCKHLVLLRHCSKHSYSWTPNDSLRICLHSHSSILYIWGIIHFSNACLWQESVFVKIMNYPHKSHFFSSEPEDENVSQFPILLRSKILVESNVWWFVGKEGAQTHRRKNIDVIHLATAFVGLKTAIPYSLRNRQLFMMTTVTNCGKKRYHKVHC